MTLDVRWDWVVDVVVVGSGAAGLTAAVAASDSGCTVEVLEKGALIGGTTAFSGGGVWVPVNRHMHELGIEDSREEALAYIRGLTDGREPDPVLLEVYVDGVVEAVEYLETRTPLRFEPSPYFSDYFADRPGAKLGGRTLNVLPYGAREALGEWDDRIRDGPHFPRLTLDEVAGADTATGGATGAVEPSPRLVALAAEREREGIRTIGGAMVACLLRAALDRGVDVHSAARVESLVMDGDAVVGVIAEVDGAELAVSARCGVVLATGGFDWNQELVRAFLGVRQIWPLSPPTVEGDGLIMGLVAGAAIGNMTVTWAYPVSYDGHSTYEGKPLYIQGTPRQEPGCITVNRRGRRFVNEGVSYMDLPRMHRIYDPVTQTYPNECPSWMIFDQAVRDRIALADLAPGKPTPGWVHEAPTLSGLAEAIGVEDHVLCEEVERFNGHAARGVDPDFHRGTVWFEGFTSGGPSPETALAPLERPPFYAMPLYDGALGTAGGLLLDEHARVRAMRGGVIAGLYGAGNVAASVFGPTYPSGGVTLGQGLAFGYRAGRHLARRREPR